MGKKPLRRAFAGHAFAGTAAATTAPLLTVRDLAQALAPLTPDVAGTVQRIRHWTRERVLLPVDREHAGPGKHRLYSTDAVYDAAMLHVLTVVGLPVSGSRMLADGLKVARNAIPRWKAARDKGQKWHPVLVILVAASTTGISGPAIAVGMHEEGADVKEVKGLDTVLTIRLDLGKLFEQVDHGRS